MFYQYFEKGLVPRKPGDKVFTINDFYKIVQFGSGASHLSEQEKDKLKKIFNVDKINKDYLNLIYAAKNKNTRLIKFKSIKKECYGYILKPNEIIPVKKKKFGIHRKYFPIIELDDGNYVCYSPSDQNYIFITVNKKIMLTQATNLKEFVDRMLQIIGKI